MRFTTSAVLLAAVLGGYSTSSAELRHYSSFLLDGGGRERIVDIDVNGDHELFVEASLENGSSFGPGAEGPGVVIVKLDASGRQMWARKVTNTFGYGGYPRIAATPDGGVLLAGGFAETLDFGGGPMIPLSVDVFLVKLGANGAFQWQRQFGGNQIQYATAVEVDGQGNIILTGENSLTVDFGGGTIRSNGASDAFLAKLDPAGGHIWSRGYGHAGAQRGLALDVGSDNQIAVAFHFGSGNIDLGTGSIFNVGESDVLGGVFDAGGTLQWCRHAATPQWEDARDIAIDSGGNAFLAGFTSRPLDLGGGALPVDPTTVGAGFVASYSSSGDHRWSYVLQDSVESALSEIVADAYGNALFRVFHRSVLTFGFHVVHPGGLTLLGVDPVGTPIVGTQFDRVAGSLRMDQARDRLVIGATTGAPVDFGGGILQPNQLDVAVVTLGVKRPPQVAITQFLARETPDGVELAWSIQSGEALDNFVLTRQIEGSSTSQVLYSSPAQNGERAFIDRAPQPGRLHTYRLTITTALGDEVFSAPVSVTVAAAVNALEQNAPNPFNPVTTFAYSLAQPAHVAVVIYDTHGAVIARLDQGQKSAGRHRASWGGHNMRGEFVASGVYYYTLEGVPGVGARKMVLLK